MDESEQKITIYINKRAFVLLCTSFPELWKLIIVTSHEVEKNFTIVTSTEFKKNHPIVIMSIIPPGLLRLPLELRQSIYQSCCDTTPAPSLLRINRLIRDEAIHYIRTRLHTFCFHISKEGAGFDELARWCFKIKGHKGEKNKMKQLILKIHPPNPDKPIEMFQIWDHLQDFCKDLTTYARIPGLKVMFAESDSARWVTHGIVHSSFDIQDCYHENDIYRHDVGQILLAFSHLVKNVRRPAIVLPSSIVSTIGSTDEVQEEIISVEHLMTGKWSNGSIREDYEDLEDLIKLRRSCIEFHTAKKSKAVFERMFGQVATLDWQSLKNFENDYPYMDSLGIGHKPRYRSACRNWYCGCEDSYCEVSMPPADLEYEDEEQWYAERMERDGPCAVTHARRYPSD